MASVGGVNTSRKKGGRGKEKEEEGEEGEGGGRKIYANKDKSVVFAGEKVWGEKRLERKLLSILD